MSRPGGNVGLTHIFSELTSQDELNVPLGRSARLRYTCLSVCGKYIALGSNSGGTYIFSRDTLKYLQVVFSDANAVPVDLVSLSPSDHLIGLGLSNGQVSVFELNIEKRSKPERVRQTLDHSGHGVTVMTWDSTSTRIYVGDDTGKISVISVPSSKTKNLFSAPSQVIALLDSSIYQIQWWKEKILVSTVTHSHLFDTSKHTYSTIGTKPRAGEFGSCFFLEPNSQVPVIYCARPGSRMWEVSFEGKVLNTHQFKQLMAVPPVPVVRSRSETFEFTNDVPYQGLSTNFLKMFNMGHFIITWSSKGLYMFDPINVKLAMWTQSIKGIKEVCVYRNDIYLFLENTTVRRLTVLPIYQLFTVLASRQKWSLLAEMLLMADQVNFRPAALKRVKRDLLFNIYQGLKMEGKEHLLEQVQASMEDVSEGSIDSLGPDASEDFLDSLELKGYIFLSSGMIVREGFGADGAGGSREGSTFERYVPPPGQLTRSVSDESFYHEESIEERREGNEETSSFRGRLTSEREGEKFQQSGESVESNGFGPVAKTHVPEEDSHVTQARKNQQEKCQDKKIESLPSSTVGDSEIKPDMSKTSEINSHVRAEPVDVRGADKVDIVLGDTSRSETNHMDAGIDLSNCVEASSSQSKLPASSEKILNSSEKQTDELVHHQSIPPDIRPDECEASPGTATSLTNGGTDHSDGHMMPNSSDYGFLDLGEKSSELNTCLSSSSDKLGHVILAAETDNSVAQNLNISENLPAKVAINGSVTESPAELHQFDDQIRECSGAPDESSDTKPALAENALKSEISGDHLKEKRGVEASSTISGPTKERDTPGADDSPSLGRKPQNLNNEKESDGDLGSSGDSFSKSAASALQSFAKPFLKGQGQSAEMSRKFASDNKKTLARFASVQAPTADDVEVIAKPHRQTKKKSKSKKAGLDASRGKLGRSASVATESEAFLKLEPEYDAMSVSTISSLDEEEEAASKNSPDIRSLDGEIRETLDVKKILGSVASLDERRHSETIPPLVDRLAAARLDEDSDENYCSTSLTSSGEHILAGSSTLGPLSVLKDGLSMKLRNQTKSIIKSLKETNILTKSASVSKLDSLADQQRPQSGLSISPPPYFDSLSSPPLSPNYVGKVDEGEELLVLDTTPLYSMALEIKRKLLSSSNALLNPREAQALLTRWAEEIVLAVGHVSLELETKRREAEENGSTENTNGKLHVDRVKNNNSEATKITTLRQWNSATGKPETSAHTRQNVQTDEIVFRGIETNHATASNDINGGPSSADGEAYTPPDDTFCALSSITSVKPDNLDNKTGLDTSGDLTDTSTAASHSSEMNWWSVVHASSPFSVPVQHLELFQWLTTRCWLCGVTGNALSTLARLTSTKDNQGGLDIEDVSDSQSGASSDREEGSLHKPNHNSLNKDSYQANDSGTIFSEDSAVSMLRTLLPSSLFETFIEQKGEKEIPSLLSLLSDALTPPTNSFECAQVQDLIEKVEQGLNAENRSSLCGVGKYAGVDSNSNETKSSSDRWNSAGRDKKGRLIRTERVDEDLTVEDSSGGVGGSNRSSQSSRFTDRRDCDDLVPGGCGSQVSRPESGSHVCKDEQRSSLSHVTASPWWDSEVLRQDVDLALFTRLLFFLLDYNQVREAWEERRTRERSLLLTWVSLMKCSQDKGSGDIVSSILSDRQPKSAIDYLRSGILPHKSALKGHLLELFKQAPLMSSDFCGELSKIVSPLDLLGMCVLTGRPALVHLMRYFKQAMLDTAAFFRPVKFEQLVRQPEVRFLLLQSQLPALSGVQDASRAPGASPVLAAELFNVLPAAWMETILDKIDSDTERENIFWLCSQFKYYRLCVRLLAQTDQWRRLLSWVVERDDIRLLRNRHSYPEAYQPKDIREWTFLLSCMREVQRGRLPRQQTSLDQQEEATASDQSSQSSASEEVAGGQTREGLEDDRVVMVTKSNDGMKLAGMALEGATHLLSKEEETNAEVPLTDSSAAEPTKKTPADAEDSEVGRSGVSRGDRDNVEPDNKGEVLDQGLDLKTKVDSTTADHSQTLNSSNGSKSSSPLVQDVAGAENPWSLTWGNVGYLLLEHLGGAAAINLLVSHMTEEGDDPSQAWSGLGSTFVQACYTSFLLEGQKEQVSQELLERMSVFMWAKKPGFLSPTVHHAFKAEQNLVERRQGKETDVQRVFGQVKSLSNRSLKSEYLGGHWGVSTDLSRRCGVCDRPLKTVMSLSVQGALVYPSGHAYHRCCVSGSGNPEML